MDMKLNFYSLLASVLYMWSTSSIRVHFSISAVKQVRKNLGVTVKKDWKIGTGSTFLFLLDVLV